MSAPTYRLDGRHALVCGASSGIGRASALALAAQGAEITALARSVDKLEAMIPELLAAGAPAARFLVADLEQRDSMVESVSALVAEHGPVHILVNNTGGPPAGPLLQADEAAFLAPFGRHVLAAHRLVQTLLPGMQKAGYGRILNIVSTSVREPIPNLGVSNTIRGAVASWSKTLSKELPAGVTINNVLPGFTDTERLGQLKSAVSERMGKSEADVESGWLATVPEGRLGTPEEVAAAVAFLASPAGGFVRGQSLAVDGGRLSGI